MSRIHLLLALALACALAAAPFANGATASVVVSQVYGGGGNAGASYANDFVELLNRGATAVDLSGWTVQYAPASSTGWPTTALTGTIAPGRYYLVQLASTAQVGAALPAPEATGTTNLASAGGKIALVRDATALACGATVGSCASAAARRGSRRLRLRNRLRGLRACSGAQQHDGRTARRRRVHRLERERDRLHRGRARRRATRRRRQPRARAAARRRAPRRALASMSTCSRCCRSRSSDRA